MNARIVRTTVTLLLAALLTAACMTNQVYEDGKRMLEAGQTRDGLALLEMASREEPRNAEIRARLMRERELEINRLLEQADRERAQGRSEAAQLFYQRLLAIDPNHARAKAGLAAMQTDIRLRQQTAQAEQLFKKGDIAAADAAVRLILAENPGLAEAKALQRQVIDRLNAAAAAMPAVTAALAKPITLEFRDANIRTVFENIARTTGINFVFDNQVRPDLRVTIFVRNSTIDDAIKLMLVTNQLERKQLNENSMLIYPGTQAKLREHLDVVVRAFYLGNADAKQLANTLKSIAKIKDVSVDERLNMLLVRDTADAVRLAEKVIAAHDIAEPEVMLEVEVLEVKRGRLQELGIVYPNQFTVLNIVPNPATTVATATGTVTTANATTTTSQLTWEILRGWPASSQVGVSPNPAVNLKSESGAANLLANPRIRVKNRDKAKVHIGDRVPVITTTSTANVGVSKSVTYLDVGLKLDVEPSVLLDDEVSIKIGLEVSSIVKEIVGSDGSLAYQVGTRNATTSLRLKNGETQVLAGLITDEDRKSTSGLPGLSDLPLIGRLFANNREEANKNEIVLLITPRILRNIARPERYTAEFFAGTDAASGAPPLQLRADSKLAIAPQGVAPPPAPARPLPFRKPEAAAPGGPLKPVITGTASTNSGGQVTLSVAMPPGTRSAEFDLVYDPALVTSLSRPPGEQGDPGRVRLKAEGQAGGRPQVSASFRVVAKAAGSAQFKLENLAAQDAAGAELSLLAPDPWEVKIVQ